MSDRKTESQEKVRSTLEKIIHLFQSGKIPQAVAKATFPRFDVPSNRWSLTNRLLMLLSGTIDARGFQQWRLVGRQVKKGEKAFQILGPRMVKQTSKYEDGTEEENYVCTGFITIPVFAVEQTEGNPLEYENLQVPDLPLMDRAREWGIEVSAIPFDGRHYGFYRTLGEREEICLATPSESTFFHELAHAAHRRVLGKLQSGQEPKQEMVADLSAQVLCQLVGRQMENTLGNAYLKIEHYSQKIGKSTVKACLEILSEVEQVLKLILSGKDEVASL